MENITSQTNHTWWFLLRNMLWSIVVNVFILVSPTLNFINIKMPLLLLQIYIICSVWKYWLILIMTMLLDYLLAKISAHFDAYRGLYTTAKPIKVQVCPNKWVCTMCHVTTLEVNSIYSSPWDATIEGGVKNLPTLNPINSLNMEMMLFNHPTSTACL